MYFNFTLSYHCDMPRLAFQLKENKQKQKRLLVIIYYKSVQVNCVLNAFFLSGSFSIVVNWKNLNKRSKGKSSKSTVDLTPFQKVAVKHQNKQNKKTNEKKMQRK